MRVGKRKRKDRRREAAGSRTRDGKNRALRHTDAAALRQLVRNSRVEDPDDLWAPPPPRRATSASTPAAVRRAGRSRDRLAHWKTRSWKRRNADRRARAALARSPRFDDSAGLEVDLVAGDALGHADVGPASPEDSAHLLAGN